MNNFKSIYKKIDEDKLRDYKNSTETKLTRNETLLKLEEIKRYLLLRGHTNSIIILNYLCQTAFLLEKIIFITDTSYRNAYIRIEKKMVWLLDLIIKLLQVVWIQLKQKI